MKRFKRMLVSTDSRLSDHPILSVATEIAANNKASLTVVDVIPDLGWMTRLSTQDHEEFRERVLTDNRRELEDLASVIRQQGIDINTTLLEGKASVEITRQVLREGHDLVLAITKGSTSRSSSSYGLTARKLLRNCPSALWLVSPDAGPKPKHICVCVDTSSDAAVDKELNDKTLELGSSLSRFYNSRLSIVHAWQMPDEALLSARLKPEQVERYVASDRRYRTKQLDRFLEGHDVESTDEIVHMLKGNTAEVIPAFVTNNSVDLVVMGTIGRSGLTGMLMGNTAERLLERLECSILTVKPYGFNSPIRI